jgi:hypothetical protein
MLNQTDFQENASSQPFSRKISKKKKSAKSKATLTRRRMESLANGEAIDPILLSV